MNKTLDEALCRDFPLLYRDRHGDMRNTCMVWGFDVSDSWEPLIREASEKLEPLIQKMPIDCECGHSHHEGLCQHPTEKWIEDSEKWYRCLYVKALNCLVWFLQFSGLRWSVVACGCTEFSDSRPRASQVKSKFGSLRFYISSGTEEIYQIIEQAEKASSHICEECGADDSCTQQIRGWLWTLCSEHAEQYRAGSDRNNPSRLSE